jgi:hypothetical protein
LTTIKVRLCTVGNHGAVTKHETDIAAMAAVAL